MKINCNQQILNKSIATVLKAVTNRTTINVLKDILIEAYNEKIVLKATDINISIETSIKCNVDEVGSVLIPAKLFFEVVRKLPNEQIYIESDDNFNILLKTSFSEFKLTGHNPEEFPKFNDLSNISSKLSMDKDIFKSMIRRTIFSVGTDDIKPHLKGILFEIDENKIYMVSSDGFRISVAREDMINIKNEKVLLEGRNLGEVYKIVSESLIEEDLNISIGDKDILVSFDDTKIHLRLLENKYIDYKDVLPKDFNTKIVVNRKNLQEAIERASLMAKEGRNNLIKCSINGNLLTINSKSEEGSVKEEVIIEKIGENLDIGFNSKYLLDVFKAIDDDDIIIEFKSSLSPCAIKPIDSNEYEYLVLPVRIQ